MTSPQYKTREEWLAIVRNKLHIINGCAEAIDRDTRNTPDARHKGRLMQLEIDELLLLAYHVTDVRESVSAKEIIP